MDKTLSLRTNQQILGLFSKIQEYQPSINRIESFQKAVDIALGEKVDWAKHSKTAIRYLVNDTSAAEFIQLRVDQHKWEKIVDQVEESFAPRLSRTTIPYVVKLVLLNYVKYLEAMTPAAAVEADAVQKEATMDLSDMAKVLFQMMLTDKDCRELKQIREILADWREKSNEASV